MIKNRRHKIWLGVNITVLIKNEIQRPWSRDYGNGFLKEDLTNIERDNDLESIDLLMFRLQALVGSPLSINTLREALQKSHWTVNRWVDIFEGLYGLFRVSSIGNPKIRAVKREQKHYH